MAPAKKLTEIVCDYKGNFLIAGTKTKVLLNPIGDPVIFRSDTKDPAAASESLREQAARGHTNRQVNAYNITVQGYQTSGSLEGAHTILWVGAAQYYRAAKLL